MKTLVISRDASTAIRLGNEVAESGGDPVLVTNPWEAEAALETGTYERLVVAQDKGSRALFWVYSDDPRLKRASRLSASSETSSIAA
jgi:hypothetical protein